MKKNSIQKTNIIAYIIIAIIAVLALSSCGTHKYVSNEKVIVKTDTLYKVKQKTDSVYFKDSIFVSKETRNDTVFITSDKWHTRYKYVAKIDTIYKVKTDSVYVNKEKEVVKKDYMLFHVLLFGIAAIIAIILAYKIYK